ncbi:UPK3L protein, partial [Chauna torquata]|nr:UPK3L protein [Chauna torquata]
LRARHPGAGTMLPLLLLLLATAHGLQELPYTPTLASTDLGGRITGSTFVLEQPRCVFANETYGSADIWLVVAVPTGRWGGTGARGAPGVPPLTAVPVPAATVNFTNNVQPGMPEWAFQNFPANTSAYLTLHATLLNYPCPKPAGDITVLRVGSETSCAKNTSRPNCNGPLPSPGPYRVKFLALNGSNPVAETRWSEPITLKTAQQPPSSPEAGGRRGAGMIAITSILSILLAVLLASLVATLAFCGSDPCGSSGIFKPEATSVRRYNTHHVYDQPAARL